METTKEERVIALLGAVHAIQNKIAESTVAPREYIKELKKTQEILEEMIEEIEPGTVK